MGLAENKIQLLNIVDKADEKLTGLMLALANEYNSQDYQFTNEDLAKFDESHEDYLKNPEQVYSMEESIKLLRSKLTK